MAPKTEKKRNRTFVIIGLGTVGSTVATDLARSGNHVLGIDINEKSVAALSDILSEAIIADGRDEEALREAGVDKYDVALIAIGEDLEANILCTMNVKMLGVKTVWVKAINKTHHRILTKLEPDRVILPEQEIGQHIAQKLHNPAVRDYLSLGNGMHVINLEVPESMAGKTIESLDLEKSHELRCLGILRGSEFIGCDTGTVTMEASDKILILGRRQNLRDFSDGI
ncbi:trk system potassium uptake protein TrkA [Thalassospira sp. MBR-102]|jgi:trk system potassium uptake protein TrkA|uniref:Potassium uptake protein KtrA n=1 Tax=Thalassospira xiamenensis M-5 = DSM 17429 TaxID=1123366 RepID=A0AB72U7M2_9PROT|nr:MULTISPECIES: TrkA family potassium uptake protein [Thalassospira]PTB84271.1 TrkA family potassium uptake protein [Marinobacter vinifirmus]AJD50204.1 potassium uptake protein KtrA [Thalassospira xiamenensis M-5 = DSM 17429]MAB31803.1 TrkA family potassium uptake protein [Thalassospira sp.]MDM7977572.1 TrkA family potassium uptake protein [Thalassospira xiamenensis]OHZ04663.1 potassium transporter KtrA [Thalassospira sp. MIT1004]|tara:strand:+ start:2063 stop:2740 length:678 start_codon:yes stop_codon:yes gene_type:complete